MYKKYHIIYKYSRYEITAMYRRYDITNVYRRYGITHLYGSPEVGHGDAVEARDDEGHAEAHRHAEEKLAGRQGAHAGVSGPIYAWGVRECFF